MRRFNLPTVAKFQSLTLNNMRQRLVDGPPNAKRVGRLTAGQRTAFLNQLKVDVGRFQPDLKRMVEQEGKQDELWKRTKVMAAAGGAEGRMAKGRKHKLHVPEAKATTECYEEAGLGNPKVLHVNIQGFTYKIPSKIGHCKTQKGHPPPDPHIPEAINKRIFDQICLPYIVKKLERHIEGNTAPRTITLVEDTHTDWVCRRAIEEVKKDRGLCLYKEHIVEHGGMQGKKGHWDEGEEKVKVSYR
ncbi:uncharacterized protein JCM10292_005753 [Rhodotorula paludigena]|uniref:uncharacterized protein n=1 Tax=Rhodotorula paludigena TaxID=86838 RepID=UPI003170C7EC